MTFQDHFSEVAAKYAAYRPRYPAALVDALADRCANTDVAWDIGCGTGQLSVDLARRFARVVAQDPAAALVEKAVRAPGVEYSVAPAEASGLPDASADLAVAAQAAHWFDWPRAVAEIGRVVRPGGLVALASYGIVIVDGAAGEVIADWYWNVAGPHWPPGRQHVENGYRDLAWPWPPVELDAASPALEMRAAWTREELIGYVTSWSATAKLVREQGMAPVLGLDAALAKTWPAGEAREIRWPLTLKLARLL